MEKELTEEEIKKRLELMKENCIFCKITKKEFDSKVIFEDDICMAILDINPVTQGHMLLFPKEHYMMMPMAPDEILGHLSIISKYLSDLLKETFSLDEVTIYIANGTAAGQQSQHFMMHIIPRYEDDGINFNIENMNQEEIVDNINEEKLNELNELVEKLKNKLNNFNPN